LFFDSSARGRLVKLQALLPDDVTNAWRTVLTDCLGGALGARCVEVIDTGSNVVAERIRLPMRDWAQLTEVQWPALHDAFRQEFDLPPLPADQRARGVVAVDHMLVMSDEDGAVSLPAPMASIGAVGGTVEVRLEGQSAHVVAQPRGPAGPPLLEAMVASPEPLAPDPVLLERVGSALAAEIPLREPVGKGASKRCLVHLAVRSGGFPFVFTVREPRGEIRQFLGARDPEPSGTTFGDPSMGWSPDHIHWRVGKDRTDVAVVCQGEAVVVRGTVAKPRGVRWLRVRCTLSAGAVEALQPEGHTGPGGGRITVEGEVERDGFFQFHLATVIDASYDGALVDTLDIEIG
jgi:hypothetical protein